LFGRIPKAGERAEVNGFEIEVLHAERTRVHSVRLRRLPPKAEEG
jgi:CBS domain containing-hemolysin-like protein